MSGISTLCVRRVGGVRQSQGIRLSMINLVPVTMDSWQVHCKVAPPSRSNSGIQFFLNRHCHILFCILESGPCDFVITEFYQVFRNVQGFLRSSGVRGFQGAFRSFQGQLWTFRGSCGLSGAAVDLHSVRCLLGLHWMRQITKHCGQYYI